MTNNIQIILAILFFSIIIQIKGRLPCFFPESDVEPFISEVQGNNQHELAILNTVVEPPHADLSILNVRSNNLPKVNFSTAFELRRHSNGQFIIILKPNLLLPPYPGHVNETTLTITVLCNKASYQLLTLKVKQPNLFPPIFYNSPYKLHISQVIESGTMLESPILAIDWDPNKKYSITYKIISGNVDNTFSLIPSNTTFYNRRVLPTRTPEGRQVPIKWAHSQLPPIVNILVNHPLTQRQYNLIIEASDNNDDHPNNSTVNLTIFVEMKDEIVPVFTKKEYTTTYSFNSKSGDILLTDKPIEAFFDQTIESNETILYVMEESDVASLFDMDLITGQISVKKDLTPDTIGGNVKIEIRAYSSNNPHRYSTAILTLSEDTTNIIGHFSPCYQEVSIRENSKNGTILTRLNVVGSYQKIVLLDSHGIFTVNSKNEIVVFDDTLLDREEVPSVEIKAQLIYNTTDGIMKETLKEVSPCKISLINVTIIDENDNSPQFDKPSYYFGFTKIPKNNTEVGIIKAFDIDEGVNSDLEYIITNDGKEDSLPFILVYKDDGVAIVYEKKDPLMRIEKYYTFVVEVTDLSDNPRTSKMTVAVDFDADPERVRQKELEKVEDEVEKDVIKEHEDDSHIPLFGVITSQNIDNTLTSFDKDEVPQYTRHFEKDKYIFDVFGVIDVNQYVGAVKIIDALPEEEIIYELEVTTPGVFEINGGTGEIFTGPNLLSMEHDGLEFVFEASARRKHIKVAKTDIVVRMDSSRNIFVLPPRFEQAIYNFKVPENRESGRIGVVKAHHRAEEMLNDRTIYSILTLDGQSKYFVIDGNTGEINSTKQFDFESDVTRFELKILGCLISKPALCGEADVLVSIIDVNDNPPAFDVESYNFTVPMDLSAGSEVTTVFAKDIDSGKNGQVSYKLKLNEEDKDLFSIDNVTGVIYLEKEFEKRLVYQIEVEASDNGDPQLSSRTTINIILGGSNPTAPEFDEFRYDIYRESPIPTGVVLVQVHASDPDPGPEGIVKYQFGNASNNQMKKNLEKLSINKDNGKISSVVELTANDGPVIQIVVEAIDQSSIFKRKSQTVVVIHIVSNQTDYLEFVPLPKIVYISSEKSLGSPIIRVSAKSSLKELIVFSLESDNRIKRYFKFEQDKLILNRKLQPGEYILKMKASIRNDYLTASHQMKVVVMKDREKFPVFERLSYQFHVPINDDFPLKLPQLNCTLSNSPIEYSLFPTKNLPEGLNIDEVTGEITINETFVITYRKKGYVFVVVRARNMMAPQFFSDVGVTIKVDDTVFSSLLYRFTIDENTPVGSVINSSIKITNVESNDERDIQYFVEPDDKFGIDTNGNLIVKKLIDLEKMRPESNGVINLNVIAKQNGETTSAKVQIKINDVNEFPPVFVDEILKFTIHDNNANGDQLGVVTIHDDDFTGPGPLKYEFETQGEEVFVNIDNEGKIVLTDDVSNIEPGEYELLLTVKDKNGSEIEKMVSFERISLKNGSEPVLYEMEPIDWNVPVGSGFFGTKLLITMPVVENALADWKFDIVEGNEENMFKINHHNGSTAELEIVTNDIHQKLYNLDIGGKNLANKLESMTLSVTVNFTNALRQFIPEFVINIPETLHIPSNHNFTKPIFSATSTIISDPSLPILYTIESNSPDKIFSIDKNGNVFMIKNPNEDGQRGYKVIINAVSGTFKNEKELTIVVDNIENETTTTEMNIITMTPSDKEISFAHSNYYFLMDKNSERGAVIGHVDFTKNNFKRDLYKLSIDPEEYDMLFDADINTGKVVMKRIPLTGWNDENIKFNINLIEINSDNANPPKANINVVIHNTETTMRTITEPSTTTSEDISSIDITPSTIERNSSINDHSITSTTMNTLIVTSFPIPTLINTSSIKIFEHTSYFGEIDEGYYPTGTFISLKPSNFRDESLSSGRNITYNIIISENLTSIPTNYFPIHIRKNSGDIIVAGDVDREKSEEIRFIVEGIDEISPNVKEKVYITIKINDLNDNKPIFELNTPMVIPIFSTTRPTEIVGTIKAIDSDEGLGGKVSYMIDDHGMNLFTIDKNNGNIILLKPLEYGNRTNYVDIIATDNGVPPQSSIYKLRIDVFPVNSEEEPKFNEPSYTYKVSLNHPLDVPFGQVVAGVGEYIYSVSPESTFTIDENNGKLYLVRSPEIGECGESEIGYVNGTSKISGLTASTSFEVIIDSCDSPRPSQLPPTLKPSNGDMTCLFDSKVYQGEVIENAVGINKLLTLSSNCQNNGIFSIVEGDDKFIVDQETGEFFAAKPLDYEIKTIHYIIVQVRNKLANETRKKRQPSSNKIIDDYVKNRLAKSQALVVIHVLDSNDNAPKFEQISTNHSKYTLYMEWKTKTSSIIGGVKAFDADINDNLEYYIDNNLSSFPDNQYFEVETDSGNIMVVKDVMNYDKDEFNIVVGVSDSIHNVTNDVTIYKITPGVNIVSVEINDTIENVDERNVIEKVSSLTNNDVKLLEKHEINDVNDSEKDSNKTQLLVYAIDKNNMKPLKDDKLKNKIIEKLGEIHNNGIEIVSVSTLTNYSTFGFSNLEYLLIILSIVLLLLSCCICCLIFYFCSRGNRNVKSEKDYMIDVVNAGPRPYNVELISRKTAQEILQSNEMPEPKEDVTDALEALYGKIDRKRKINKRKEVNFNDIDRDNGQIEYTHDRGMSYDIENPTHIITPSIVNRAYSPNEHYK
uniref:DE-cadherin (inferred by orthology to a D. melanogaster protein) n=1 Tax=Strongyloides venezuelensis TaxID=75913 RepID=A0A0K0EV61_STRVS